MMIRLRTIPAFTQKATVQVRSRPRTPRMLPTVYRHFFMFSGTWRVTITLSPCFSLGRLVDFFAEVLRVGIEIPSQRLWA